MIIEPIQGQELVIPPAGYLRSVAELCRKNDILLTIDEIKVGMGRTGKLFAFMHEEGVVPDVLTISKAIGGGKCAMGVMVTSERHWRKAYGKRKDSALHSTTFGGIGQSCAVGIKALEIISNPEFLDTVAKRGEYMLRRLEAVKQAHPRLVSRVFGRGLFVGIEFNFGGLNSDSIRRYNIPFLKDANAAFMCALVRKMYNKHRVLCSFSPPRPSLMMLMPPLIITNSEIDRFVGALDACLEDGFAKLFFGFVRQNLIGSPTVPKPPIAEPPNRATELDSCTSSAAPNQSA